VPARNHRELPWHSTLQRRNGNGNGSGSDHTAVTVQGNGASSSSSNNSGAEQVRPIFWSNRQASYIARTAAWDEFPNGRWGDRASPAYGELSEYYLAFKRPKADRVRLWGTPQSAADVNDVFVRFLDGQVKQLPWCEQALSLESAAIREHLKWLNANASTP
jgi:hypothetical protein